MSDVNSAALESSKLSAFRLLDQYLEADMISAKDLEFHKDLYARLNDNVLHTFHQEIHLLKVAKELNNELLRTKIKAEKQAIRKAEEYAATTSLEQAKERALKELVDSVDRDAIMTFELSEMQREYADLETEKEEILQAHTRILEPQIRQVTNEIKALKEDRLQLELDKEKENQRKDEMSARLAIVESENAQLAEEVEDVTSRIYQIQHDPERMKKQANIVQQAVDNLIKELAILQAKNEDLKESIEYVQTKLGTAELAHKELTQKLDVHNESTQQRQRDVEHVTLHLREEQNNYVHILAEKARLQIELKQLGNKVRHESDALQKKQKHYDLLKRELKTKILNVKAQRDLLPNLKTQVADAVRQLEAAQAENKRQELALDELKKQNESLLSIFSQQEQDKMLQKEQHRALLLQLATLENALLSWNQEEIKQKKLKALLTEQREMKAREARIAIEAERSIQKELKMKEILIISFAKRWSDMNTHVKEFSALYDAVKNERNKYAGLLQSSSQALGEMREKIKILNSETEILRNEWSAKEKALEKERLAHSNAQFCRDSLRLQINKIHDQYSQKQDIMEQKILNIETLNTAITQTERFLLRLKKSIEIAIDSKNRTGTQLIAYNDRLCVMYEKDHAQKDTLRTGDLSLTQLDQSIQLLNVELQNAQRQVERKRMQLPLVPQLSSRVAQLHVELEQERKQTSWLCRDLETPDNADRWRLLNGQDLDLAQLLEKTEKVHARLNYKKEQLLEKKLVLEEVTQLSDELRSQAAQRRGDSLNVSKQVNVFQAKLKETTRQMMAVVSELSMYQATAMKLKEENIAAVAELNLCQQRMAKSEPPTMDAVQQLMRTQQQKWNEEEMRLSRMNLRSSLQQEHWNYTTAEQRPNAYIPQDILIPKPYGGLAPFKPSVKGANMRHIRAPQRQDIEI